MKHSHSQDYQKHTRWLWFIAIAGVLLGAAGLGTSVYFYEQYSQLEEEVIGVVAESRSLTFYSAPVVSSDATKVRIPELRIELPYQPSPTISAVRYIVDYTGDDKAVFVTTAEAATSTDTCIAPIVLAYNQAAIDTDNNEKLLDISVSGKKLLVYKFTGKGSTQKESCATMPDEQIATVVAWLKKARQF